MNNPATAASTPVTSPAAPAAAKQLRHLSYTHEAMIDLILAEPTVTTTELAALFCFSPNWVSRVLASDSFQARLGERKAALIDPSIRRRLDERFRAVAVQSTQLLQDRLDSEEGAGLALDALGVATTAMRAVRKSAGV